MDTIERIDKDDLLEVYKVYMAQLSAMESVLHSKVKMLLTVNAGLIAIFGYILGKIFENLEGFRASPGGMAFFVFAVCTFGFGMNIHGKFDVRGDVLRIRKMRECLNGIEAEMNIPSNMTNLFYRGWSGEENRLSLIERKNMKPTFSWVTDWCTLFWCIVFVLSGVLSLVG